MRITSLLFKLIEVLAFAQHMHTMCTPITYQHQISHVHTAYRPHTLCTSVAHQTFEIHYFCISVSQNAFKILQATLTHWDFKNIAHPVKGHQNFHKSLTGKQAVDTAVCA